MYVRELHYCTSQLHTSNSSALWLWLTYSRMEDIDGLYSCLACLLVPKHQIDPGMEVVRHILTLKGLTTTETHVWHIMEGIVRSFLTLTCLCFRTKSLGSHLAQSGRMTLSTCVPSWHSPKLNPARKKLDNLSLSFLSISSHLLFPLPFSYITYFLYFPRTQAGSRIQESTLSHQ